VAPGTAYAGEAALEPPAVEIGFDDTADHRPQRSVLLLEAILVDLANSSKWSSIVR